MWTLKSFKHYLSKGLIFQKYLVILFLFNEVRLQVYRVHFLTPILFGARGLLAFGWGEY